MRSRFSTLLFVLSTAISLNGQEQPNILLIVADDLGYSDLGCYGGEIATPNIDKLARQGIMFSRFHAYTMCAPSRAMFLSGNDNHMAGVGSQSDRRGYWGYEGHLSNRVAIIPEVLGEAGYHTYMAGKWHIGFEKGEWPSDRGFEHCYANLYGTESHYDEQHLFAGRKSLFYTEDSVLVERPEGVYSTDLYTDKLIEQIDRHKDDGEPFFAYAAYSSPHWPLKVDSSFWLPYSGNYDEGYEVLRVNRLQSLKEHALVNEAAELPPLHPLVKPWTSLTEEEKLIERRKMELYAGMVANLDHHIGRLLDHLRETGLYENTLIVFISDNGAAAEDFYTHPRYGAYLREHFSDAYELMGLPESFVSYGPQWAEACNAPFKYFKQEATQGAVLAPMIISGAGVTPIRTVNHSFVTLTDLAPTFYELAGAKYPQRKGNIELAPLIGSSLVPIMSGAEQSIHGEDYVWGMEHRHHTFVIKGDWKLVNNSTPHDPEAFELYNLREDIGEIHDLSRAEPAKFEELHSDWRSYVERYRVRLD